MGMYDTIALPCPQCGELYYAQSKSGECVLGDYTFENCPEDVMANVNRHAPFECFECKTIFQVELTPTPTIVKTDKLNDDFPELPDNADKEDILSAFLKYQEKINNK